MQELVKIANAAIELMPLETRFNSKDAAAIARHRELLLSWGPELVERFYNTVYDHGPTMRVFREGERSAREQTLANWWQRTVGSPIDQNYFAWMAKVGLVHVVRKVENPMMLAMSGYVTDFVKEKATKVTASGFSDALEVIEAFQRLSMTVSAIITFGYDEFRLKALFNVVGMEAALLHRLTTQEAEGMLGRVNA